MWRLWPQRYASTAVWLFNFREHPDERSKEKVRNFMRDIPRTAYSQSALNAIAQQYHLTAELNSGDIRVTMIDRDALADNDSIICCWAISFISAQANLAQQTTQELMSTFIDYIARYPLFPQPKCPGDFADCSGRHFEPLQVASAPRDLKPPLWQFAIVGALLGSLAGALTRKPLPT